MTCFKRFIWPVVRYPNHVPVSKLQQAVKSKMSLAGTSRLLSTHSTASHTELFEYTSGRWLWNDAKKHDDRRRIFNIPEFKHLAAKAVGQNAEDVTSLEKLGEGGFNRALLVTMRDGFRFVGRIPYASTEPKSLLVASEVATMRYLRLHGLPVPEVYSYSATSENAAGVEYIFMEFVDGRHLGDHWPTMPDGARIKAVKKLVELEARLFALELPAYGSLFYAEDLPAGLDAVKLDVNDPAHRLGICIGPDTRSSMWYSDRRKVHANRGPYTNPVTLLAAGAQKEIAYLNDYGRPLHPLERMRREIYGYKKQAPTEHLESLRQYLDVAPYLTPKDHALAHPTLKHPDFSPNNVFVTEKLEITGVIDWQLCTTLPLFLQIGLPSYFRQCGDGSSSPLVEPELPVDFESLTDSEKIEQLILQHGRQLHYTYVNATKCLNPRHYEASIQPFSALILNLYNTATWPWQGDNVALKASLIDLTKHWSEIRKSVAGADEDASLPCPTSFSKDETDECLRLDEAQVDTDNVLESIRDQFGVEQDGHVELDLYDEVKQRASKFKADTLAEAESEEERAIMEEHWPFDDYDEGEYA